MATHKIVKVKIVRKPGTSKMQYPATFKAKEVAELGIVPSALSRIGYSGGLSRGEGAGYCLIVLPNILADEYALDPDMETITVTAADILLEQWRQDKHLPEETVTNPNRIAAIQAKLDASIALSQDDLDALDPDSRVPGIENTLLPVKEKFPGLFS